MPMLEQNGHTEISRPVPHAAFERQQRRRMLIALLVLALALIAVIIKDRQFWFPPSPSAESDTPEQTVPQLSPQVAPTKTVTPVAPPKAVGPVPHQSRAKSKRLAATAHSTETHETQDAMSPVITATNRAVLPPLEVEVVAGNQHRPVNTADNSVKLEMQPSNAVEPEPPVPSAQSQGSASGPSNARAQVQLSPSSAQVVSRVDPSYPLLAKQMKVQGAVILEALISKNGSIQDIQVLSGPAILSEAAREAVKQWHFKPYYQSGRPVETEARITVNFTISTY